MKDIVWTAAIPYAGSLVIEDNTLEVNSGSSVNLRVKLGAQPASDVTVVLSETSA